MIAEFRFVLLITAALWMTGTNAQTASDQGKVKPCQYNRSEMLNFDFQSFDQDLSNGGGGWRKLLKSGCERVAADLIRDYRRENRSTQNILVWHEGQMRAMAGQHLQAIKLFEMSKHIEDETGWNAYVDATTAFLKKDKRRLIAARGQLAKVEYPPELPPLTNGYFQVPNGSGKSVFIRWPPNIDVVDGLIKCFDKPYGVAYGLGCRPPTPEHP